MEIKVIFLKGRSFNSMPLEVLVNCENDMMTVITENNSFDPYHYLNCCAKIQRLHQIIVICHVNITYLTIIGI